MDHFPDEITTNILSRIPSVAHTLRCRSVCQRWRDIIDDHHFPLLHYTNALLRRQSDFLLLPWLGSDIYRVEQDTQALNPPQFKATRLRNPTPLSSNSQSSNPCNGFLAICTYSSANNSRNATRYHIYICNIVTQECMKLPDFYINRGPSLGSPFVHNFGLGFDEENKAFKLLLTVYVKLGIRHSRPIITQVFTLGSDSWRNLDDFPSETCWRSPVSMNGSLYWLRTDSVLSFDLASETFRSMEMPLSASPVMRQNFRLVLLSDCLSIIDTTHGEHIELWIMIKESWSKLVINKRYADHGDHFTYVCPMSLGRNGEVLLLYHSGVLVSFEAESGKYSSLRIEGFPNNLRFGDYEVHPFVGNLMRLKHTIQNGTTTT